MLRAAAILLLLANLAYFAWTQGHLEALGLVPQEQREPERLQAQVQPQTLRLLNGPRAVEPAPPPEPVQTAAPGPDVAGTGAEAPATPPEPTAAPATEAPAPVAEVPANPIPPAPPPPVAQTPETTACWQAGGFTEAQTEALRTALGQLDLPRSWQFIEARSGGRWIVYMGRYDNQEQVERKKAELRELKVSFRELSAAGLGPGLALGTYSSEAAAEKALADIVRTGVRTARVAQERAESSSFTLRLPRITPTQRTAVAGLSPLLAGRPLKRCN
ncbi:signal peptide protein [Hydrogenophaga taeniospiralis CCUG 15921]|uniref:Signal peptide protein n=1 Tax=Hydrogenophaga taeniospiralis CCUG 15921 TaxID=1281780 RepID=A0A9X4S8V2_9BURK|nr:SPOR domain-containing protein [Hydrogenophaga taeniospiralis]MDG5975875.1 signal peptide protein [Hydrogenophaga taeniospiralis CCUG 15921]